MGSFLVRRMLLACCLVMIGTAAAAQAYPSRPVRIVVPVPPGGSNDIIARMLAQKLSGLNGQQLIVENRAGAGGNIAAEAVAISEPDGYTLLLSAPPPLTINAALYKDLPFDPLKAFAPIALVATVPIVLAVHPSLDARNLGDLIALAKARPGTINFGSSGNGSTNHLTGELLKSVAGIDIVHVPYRGAAPAMNDLVAGHIPMMFDNMPGVLQQVQRQRIIAIAVAGAQRAAAMPDVPTIAESGLSGFEVFSWFGLVAPAKTPAPILAKLQQDVAAILKQPGMEKRLSEVGAEPGTVFGAAFGKFLAEDSAKWSKIIKASGAKLD